MFAVRETGISSVLLITHEVPIAAPITRPMRAEIAKPMLIAGASRGRLEAASCRAPVPPSARQNLDWRRKHVVARIAATKPGICHASEQQKVKKRDQQDGGFFLTVVSLRRRRACFVSVFPSIHSQNSITFGSSKSRGRGRSMRTSCISAAWAARKNKNPVAQTRGLLHFVRHKNDCLPCLLVNALQFQVKLQLDHRIQSSEWLVDQQHAVGPAPARGPARPVVSCRRKAGG